MTTYTWIGHGLVDVECIVILLDVLAAECLVNFPLLVKALVLFGVRHLVVFWRINSILG